MHEARFLGIDFSGAAAPWKARCSRPTVWVATVEAGALVRLQPVQALAGDGAPFTRLVALLAAGEFRAAGIDAPFSLPTRHVPTAGHRALLRAVGRMPAAADRPFPSGDDLYRFASDQAPLEGAKPYRETERMCGATARSTLWNGAARPGTPFTAACLTLLARAKAPIWPWSDMPGMLVEAFPMAQLRRWGLPFRSYGAPDQSAARETIVRGLAARLALPRALRAKMAASPDALDAVVAAFGGMAAANGALAHPLPKAWKVEGAIAVHD